MAGSYETIRSYDVPGVLLGQLMGGDLSFESIKDTLLSRERLTPQERKTIAERMVGETPVLRTLAEVATNPWVWLMFLSSPVGSKLVAKGLPFGHVAEEFSAYKKTHKGFLDNVRTDMDVVGWGTGADVYAMAVEDLASKHARKFEAYSGFEKSQRKLLERLDELMEKSYGRKGKWDANQPFHPESYLSDTPEHRMAHKLQDLLFARSRNLDTTGDYVMTKVGRTKGRAVGPTDPATGQPTFDVPIESDLEKTQNWHLEQLRQTNVETWKATVLELHDKLVREWVNMKPADRATYWHNDWDEFWAAKGVDVQGMKDPRVYVEIEETLAKKAPRIVDAKPINDSIKQLGQPLQDYLEARKKRFQYAFVQAYGDEAHFLQEGQFRFDKTKMGNLTGALIRDAEGMPAKGSPRGWDWDPLNGHVEGKDLLMSIVEQDGWNLIEKNIKGPGAAQVIQGQLEKALGLDQWGNPWWAPRNTFRVGKVTMNGVKRTPLDSLRGLEGSLENAPWATSHSARAADRIAPITTKKDLYDQEMLERWQKYGWLTETGEQFAIDNQKAIDEIYQSGKHGPGGKPKAVMVATPYVHEGAERYVNNLTTASILDTNPAPAHMLHVDGVYTPYVDPEIRTWENVVGGGHRLKRGDPVDFHGADKVTMGFLFDRVHTGLGQDEWRQGVLGSMVNTLSRKLGPGHIMAHTNLLRSKETARWFADGMLGKLLEKHGGSGAREWVQGLREYAEVGSRHHPRDFGSALANYLYVSHLGLNVASAIVNITQPLLMAALVGNLDDVVGAWVDSSKDMFRYAKNRMKLGPRIISNAEKERLVRDSFPFANFQGDNLLDIGPRGHEIMEGLGGHGEGTWDKLTRFMMSGFEKTEWNNRNFTVHLMRRLYAKAGKSINSPGFVEDAKAFMRRTQFAQSDINTPQLFKEREGSLLGHRLIRQFMSFPLRQLTGVLDTMPTMAAMGGDGSYVKGLFNTVAKGMGMSALVYEVGKHTFGVDLSRGLFAGGTFSAVGGQGQDSILPSPPIVSIPGDFVMGLIQGDAAKLAGTVARVVPGGVALSRALGVMPEMNGLLGAVPGVMQKTYAGWGEPLETGEVPVYKRDGMLMGYYKPSLLIAKGLGVDLGKFAAKGELDYYLSKQVELNGQYKREYKQALMGHEYGKAEGVAQEYHNRLGVPLTVSRQEIRQYLRSQSRARGERILDRLPANVRPAYATMVERGGVAANVRPGGFQGGATATRREGWRENAVREADVQAMLDAHDRLADKKPKAFESFAP